MSPALLAAIFAIIPEIEPGCEALANLFAAIKGEPLTDAQLAELEAAVAASDARLQSKLNADLNA